MAKNEKTSRALGQLASAVLSGRKNPTSKEVKRLAGAVLTQRPDHR